jgi:dihydrofolate reductase
MSRPWKAIAAVGPRGEIGLKSRNCLPWSIAPEYQHFLDSTAGGQLIMGRQTFMEMIETNGVADPAKQANFLSTYARVFVLTSSSSEAIASAAAGSSKVVVVSSLAAVHKITSSNDAVSAATVWVAGGAGVYREAITSELVGELVLTKIATYPGMAEHKAEDLVFFPLAEAVEVFKNVEVVQSVPSENYVIYSYTK